MTGVLRTILSGVQWSVVRDGSLAPPFFDATAPQDLTRMAAPANAPSTPTQVCCRRMRLSELRRGEVGRIAGTDADAGDAAYLSALGLRPETRVRMCACGDTCIVAPGSCGGSRIGLARGLARRIEVVVD